MKDNIELSTIPRCWCSSTFRTGVSLNRIKGLSIGFLFQENVISTACLVGFGLKDIFHLFAHCLRRFKSSFKSLAADTGSRTTVKNDVSSAKSFTLHTRLSVRSLIYTKKKRGPNIEPWGTPSETLLGAQIKYVTKSFNPKVKQLKSMKYLQKAFPEEIYFKTVIPSATYCLAACESCSESLFQKIEKIHVRTAKIIHGIASDNADEDVLPKAKWDTISYLYKRKLLIIMQNAHLQRLPDWICDLFNK